MHKQYILQNHQWDLGQHPVVKHINIISSTKVWIFTLVWIKSVSLPYGQSWFCCKMSLLQINENFLVLRVYWVSESWLSSCGPILPSHQTLLFLIGLSHVSVVKWCVTDWSEMAWVGTAFLCSMVVSHPPAN